MFGWLHNPHSKIVSRPQEPILPPSHIPFHVQYARPVCWVGENQVTCGVNLLTSLNLTSDRISW